MRISKRKLVKEEILQIPELVRSGMSPPVIAKQLDIPLQAVGKIFAGQTYLDIQPEFQKKLAIVLAEQKDRPVTWECTKCEKVLPRTEEFFSPVRNRKAGFEARCRVCKKIQNTLRYIKSKMRVLRHYSGGEPHCQCCNNTNYEFLTIDHINGGGIQHRKEIREGEGSFSGIHFWLEKNNFPEGFRVLCANCNSAYGYFGYCPHNGRPEGSIIGYLENNLECSIKEYLVDTNQYGDTIMNSRP